MAQQTINVGAAPNDGTGTPLRTAFQYTNSNFTELYTAVGPSGNNIVVPGNATITGDLTVDTSTLKVTASTDTVTVGATTTDAKFRVVDANYNGLRIGFFPGTLNYNLYDATVHEFRTASVTPQQLYTLQASSSVWYDGAGGTRMTLNSNGLGVGGSPTAKLSVVATGKGFVFGSTSATGAYAAWQYNSADVGYVGNGTSIVAGAAATDFGLTSSAGGKLWLGSNNGASYAVLDSSGNVGIGVVPSATNSTYFQALELARVGQGLTAAKNVLTGSPSSWLSNNSYATYSSGVVWNYAISQPAAQYRLFEGQHQWYTAPSGTAGNAITFTERLRLKETGQLRFVPLASDPSGAEAGDVYYNSTSNKLKCYNGTTWNDLF